MDKVKVSREISDALDYETRNFSKKSIIDAHVKHPKGWALNENKALNDMDLDVLIRALYYGYMVEKTPEDKIADWYEELELYRANKTNPLNRIQEADFQMIAIKCTLDTLGIKIKGVNC